MEARNSRSSPRVDKGDALDAMTGRRGVDFTHPDLFFFFFLGLWGGGVGVGFSPGVGVHVHCQWCSPARLDGESARRVRRGRTRRGARMAASTQDWRLGVPNFYRSAPFLRMQFAAQAARFFPRRGNRATPSEQGDAPPAPRAHRVDDRTRPGPRQARAAGRKPTASACRERARYHGRRARALGRWRAWWLIKEVRFGGTGET